MTAILSSACMRFQVYSLAIVLFQMSFDSSFESDVALKVKELRESQGDELPLSWTTKMDFYSGHKELGHLIKTMIDLDPDKQNLLQEVKTQLRSLMDAQSSCGIA